MHQRIVYGNPTRFYLDGQEVAEQVFRTLTARPARLKDMLESQRSPFIMTDDVFLAGMLSGPQLGNKAVAEAQGVSVNGAVYMPGLASFPDDPTAWVRGRGDIARIAEEKNLTIRSAFMERTARRDEAPPPDVEVADDCVEQRVLDMLEKNPDLRHGNPAEVYHEARASLLPAPPEEVPVLG